jgi:hypothetical protein
MPSIFIRIALVVLLLTASFTGAFAQNKPETPDRSWRKAVPEITWKNISPPFKDYRYYDHVEVYPFEHISKAFSPINAWWLSEAATLVYADEDFVRIRFRKAGMSQVVYFNKDSTQCFVASNDKFALVVFRGSEIWKKKEKFDLSMITASFMTGYRKPGKKISRSNTSPETTMNQATHSGAGCRDLCRMHFEIMFR